MPPTKENKNINGTSAPGSVLQRRTPHDAHERASERDTTLPALLRQASKQGGAVGCAVALGGFRQRHRRAVPACAELAPGGLVALPPALVSPPEPSRRGGAPTHAQNAYFAQFRIKCIVVQVFFGHSATHSSKGLTYLQIYGIMKKG